MLDDEKLHQLLKLMLLQIMGLRIRNEIAMTLMPKEKQSEMIAMHKRFIAENGDQALQYFFKVLQDFVSRESSESPESAGSSTELWAELKRADRAELLDELYQRLWSVL